MTDHETRETWQARLWAANDEGLYEETRGQDAASIRDTFETLLLGEDGGSGVLGDVVGLWLGRVDWDAVADAQRDDDATPTCDICGDEDDGAGDDWNGDTGCHVSCESAG